MCILFRDLTTLILPFYTAQLVLKGVLSSSARFRTVRNDRQIYKKNYTLLITHQISTSKLENYLNKFLNIKIIKLVK